MHDNDPGDPAYRRFLSRLFKSVCARVAPPARGLDFGSGPGPTLSLMFTEAGYGMAIYDPFYAPDPAALRQTYDFVTASEVAEHLYAPGEVFTQLLQHSKFGPIWFLMISLCGFFDQK
ncbi:methyltransferase domain-containing protein [Nitrosococcus halophilus]|uniref:methyltransferase domain-containing protein n=1 Tax=Nitrosococcus halophilus TaxID=133539 RepID=UPI00193D024E|nr:methyltransferase domain-containing protein [Nitrosococcus halophilus]